MYLPQQFDEQDPVILHRLIRENSFATLVTVGAQGTVLANHLPFHFDLSRGTLFGHMARANPQWKAFAEPRETLVIFQGPHAYVSPTWYGKGRTDYVPTWNYVAVHAWGEPRLLSPEATWEGMLGLIGDHESKLTKPWSPDTLPEAEARKMFQAIVGFEIKVTRLEGKLKLSQNRDTAAQDSAIAALLASPQHADREIGELMKERLR